MDSDTSVRFTDHDIARVRELNPIADVARDLGHELEQGDDGQYVISCLDSLDPETRVAFSMSLIPERGMFYCAHCGEGGDAITLVEKDKNLSFTAAVEYLDQRAGVTLEAQS